MSIFSTILEKLGLKKEETKKVDSVIRTTSGRVATSIPRTSAATGAASASVDVVGKLTAMAAKSKQKLNWKTSIVDLLKLLGIDSSFENRKELAVELGCPADKLGDSAAMNEWLHKAVMKKLAANGGNVPKELLD
ncbi:MAG: DUF3597 domain-containing protein [Anaerolineaceae bacterium]|nr:DUF3597 domain-containing protein [Anaerolineaceae bacterium]MBN2677464.1 DUF3597 domain-containing protein [Anaerolineaceae bacterium]